MARTQPVASPLHLSMAQGTARWLDEFFCLLAKTCHEADFSMKFSVVIPTYNRADELRDTLTSMSRLASSATMGAPRRRQQLERRHA